MTKGGWAQMCPMHKIYQTESEPYCPWENPAQLAIGNGKRHEMQLMMKIRTHIRLYDYCSQYVSEIRSLVAGDLYQLMTILLLNTPIDIHLTCPNIVCFDGTNGYGIIINWNLQSKS